MLILLRHGRTSANAAGLLQGRLDLPLDEVGAAQVRDVATAIGPVDHVITSSLLRSRETAAAFATAYTIDDRWIELDYGTYDGRPLGDVAPELWAQWRTDRAFALPDGESMAHLDQRVRSAAADALELARSETVVVVSHVTPIKAAIAWALDGDILMSWRCFLEQAAVCRIGLGPDGPILRTFNEVLWTR